MIYYRDRMCYIVLKEGEYMVQMAELIKTERRRALEIKVYGEDN